MQHRFLAPRPQRALDRCEHCGATVDRVWLVPGDVLDSCRDCFTEATGRAPEHQHGHSTPPGTAVAGGRPVPSAAAFYTSTRRRSA